MRFAIILVIFNGRALTRCSTAWFALSRSNVISSNGFDFSHQKLRRYEIRTEAHGSRVLVSAAMAADRWIEWLESKRELGKQILIASRVYNSRVLRAGPVHVRVSSDVRIFRRASRASRHAESILSVLVTPANETKGG